MNEDSNERYYALQHQDKFIDEFFNRKTNGFYVDIGAHDGSYISNSLFFEQFRNWSGICVEPGPKEFDHLKNFRKSININACISNYDGKGEYTYIDGPPQALSGLTESYDPRHAERIDNDIAHRGGKKIPIQSLVFKLQTILDMHKVYDIDFCSIDTEGSELEVAQSIDFDRTNIKVFVIENNFQETKVQDFLEAKGYSLHSKLQWDDVFIKND